MSRRISSQWTKGKWGHGIPRDEWRSEFKGRSFSKQSKPRRYSPEPSPATLEQIQFLKQWGVQWMPPNLKAANCIEQIKKSKRYTSRTAGMEISTTPEPGTPAKGQQTKAPSAHETKPALSRLNVVRQRAEARATYEMATPAIAQSPDADRPADTEPSTPENRQRGNQTPLSQNIAGPRSIAAEPMPIGAE